MLYRLLVLSLMAVLVVLVPAEMQSAAQTGKVRKLAAFGLLWTPFNASGFPDGLSRAPIYGDYTAPDGSYTIRLKFPDLYRIPPHYYPKDVSLTVLSGILILSHNNAGEIYRAGDFLHMPPATPHSGVVKGETIVQVHGVGPFEMILAK